MGFGKQELLGIKHARFTKGLLSCEYREVLFKAVPACFPRRAMSEWRTSSWHTVTVDTILAAENRR